MRAVRPDDKAHSFLTILARGVFDLRTDAGDIITGTVADALTEDELGRLATLTNQACVAELQKTMNAVASVRPPSYGLLDAQPAGGRLE